jgi:hypothetical protein
MAGTGECRIPALSDRKTQTPKAYSGLAGNRRASALMKAARNYDDIPDNIFGRSRESSLKVRQHYDATRAYLKKLIDKAGIEKKSRRTSSGTRMPRGYWKKTYNWWIFRPCWGMKASLRRRFIRMPGRSGYLNWSRIFNFTLQELLTWAKPAVKNA